MTDSRETGLRRIAVGILGPPIEHRDSLMAMLGDRAGRVVWLPDSMTFWSERGERRARLSRLFDQLRGTSEPEYLGHVLRAVDESDLRLVIAYWGTIPLPDLVALKKLRPGLKLVVLILCYPLAISTLGIYRQNSFIHHDRKYIDGVLYPTEEMADYVCDRVFYRGAPPSRVLRPCWPASFQATDRNPPVCHRPNLVYIGRTDLSARTIHASDDVRMLMRSLLNEGVELHHGASPETDDGHPVNFR